MRYSFGIAAAILAGIALNVGILIQKTAVGRASRDRPLMLSLLKEPVWISGFALQFALGTPLYALSIGLIGPALVPGLMSIGIVVLALGAVILQKERVAPKEILGIALVILAAAAFGLSRLSIDILAFSIRDPGLLLRSAAFAGALVGATLGCARAAARIGARGPSESAAALHAARAGAWYNVGNLGLGFVTAALARFWGGIVDPGEVLVFLAAVALTITANICGVAATQHALAQGRIAIAVPLQNGIAQVLPVFVFFLVYRPCTPTADSFGYLGAAGVLLLAGVVLLTGRLAAFPAPGFTQPRQKIR